MVCPPGGEEHDRGPAKDLATHGSQQEASQRVQGEVEAGEAVAQILIHVAVRSGEGRAHLPSQMLA
jgi:hypothetical protein